MTKNIDYPQGCLPIENTTNVSQQIERLRNLSSSLSEYLNDEEESNPKFRTLFTHLSQSCFLNNSNSDFKILLSNCLASILRIHPPDFPAVNDVDLKNIYNHIFRSLRGLGENTTDSPKFKNYHQLLDTVHQECFLKPLVEMKDHEANLVYKVLIKECLSVPCEKAWARNVRGEQRRPEEAGSSEGDDGDDDDDDGNTADKVEKKLIEIAVRAIVQMEFVPNEILDVLFYHIIPPQRTNFVESRKMAEEIIKECLAQPADTLQSRISNVMASAAKEGKLPDEFELTGSDNRKKFFEVLRFLHFISYELVAEATGQLNFWLQSENEVYRKEAVIIVGMLTRDAHCQFGTDKSDSTWTAFMNASGDKDDQVRHAFVEQSKEILMSNHSHLRGHVINALLRLSKDHSDDVRIAVVETVAQVAKSRLEVISDRLLKTCAERMKDKKPKVRERAIKLFMDLYHHIMTSRPQPFYSRDGGMSSRDNELSSKYTASDKECVSFIPNHIFQLYRLIQRNPAYIEARFTIERYIQKDFIPFDIDAKTRVEMLADLYRGLEDIPRLMFSDVINRSSQFRRAIVGIISLLRTDLTPEETAQLKERIHKLCQIFPEPIVLEKIMKVFVNEISQSPEAFNLIKKIMGENYTSDENKNSVLALKNILEKKFGAKTNQNVFRHFMDRVCPLSFDSIAAKELVDLVTDTVDGKTLLRTAAERNYEKDLSLLKLFTEYFSHCFTDGEIVKKIYEKMLTTDEPLAVETAIHALSRIFANTAFRLKMGEEEGPKAVWYLKLVKGLKDLIMREDPELRRSCKLATRLLSSLLGKEKATEYFESQIESLLNRLYLECDGVANAYQVLGEIYRTNIPHFFSKVMQEVESDRIGYLLMTSPDFSEDDPIDFADQTHIEKQPWPKYTMGKVYAAKFAAKVLSTFHIVRDHDQKKRMEAAAQKYIDSLCEVIEKKGELGDKQCDVEKARLRAAASGCLLKIAPIMVYRPKFHTRLFKDMSYMITDEAYCVRLYYAFHVKKGMGRRLPIEFAACYGLANLGAVEEEGESKLEGFKAICTNQAHQAFAERSEEKADMLKLVGVHRAVFCSETVIAYVVWLLANYHKFEKVEDNANKDDSDEDLEKKVANVNLLAELQECLWLVMDSLRIGKCNMQKVWKVLEKLKTCGDKPVRCEGSLMLNDMREHNKKLWALCDLGITMMLYRAKLQMQDQESKENGFNLQFFYICNDKDKADPSNVYAPDVLINDEKQRNGRVPKTRRIYHVADLTAEFTPPPQGNESVASTSSKNTSRRPANTSGNKTKAGRSTKRRSGGSNASDDEGDTEVTPPVVKKTRSKRGVYDLPEEEDEDDDAEEIIPQPKRRRAPAVSSVPSSSSTKGTPRKNGGAPSPRKNTSRASNGRQNGKRETEIEDDSEEEEAADVSLDNLVISPILNDTSGRSRRSVRTIAATTTITSSTPFVTAKPKSIKRKRTADTTQELEDVKEEPEAVVEAPSPKKRVSGRRGATSVSTVATTRSSRKSMTTPAPKSPTLVSPARKATAPKSPAPKRNISAGRASGASTAGASTSRASSSRASIAKVNGTSPKKNKYGLPIEEEDEEAETPSTSRPSVRARTSARKAKK